MHLMYTVDDQGNRVYTLKVSMLFTMRSISVIYCSSFQKLTDSGKITKSAHPGALAVLGGVVESVQRRRCIGTNFLFSI